MSIFEIIMLVTIFAMFGISVFFFYRTLQLYVDRMFYTALSHFALSIYMLLMAILFLLLIIIF